ncbi:MAG: TolC family protein, partial [Acidobacteriota bacterium]|nr:TolC family protein [Acidobacteriota bacterium]
AEVTQVIELGGKGAARMAVAEAEAGGAEAAAAVLDARVALEVSRTYLDAVRLRERHRALTLQVVDLNEAARVLDRRVAVGSTAESELLRLRTEAARADSDRVRAELAANRAIVALTSRLAIDATLDALVAPTPPVLSAPDDASLSRRPDVTAAVRAVETARQGLRLEDARGVPDPAVNAGYKRTVGYNTAQVTVSVPIPIFNRNRPARIVAAGQLTAAELERSAVERRARGEMAATRTAALALMARARDARASLLEPALGARDAARAAFSTGLLDVLRLVDAERVFTEAMLVAIDLEIDAVVSAIEARVAAGEDPLP